MVYVVVRQANTTANPRQTFHFFRAAAFVLFGVDFCGTPPARLILFHQGAKLLILLCVNHRSGKIQARFSPVDHTKKIRLMWCSSANINLGRKQRPEILNPGLLKIA